MIETTLPVSLADIEDAAARLRGRAVRTPLLESPLLGERLGLRLLLKAECLQRTGSFKFRGAYNRLSRLTDAERKAGVVAYSSGNHAQGVAAAARMLGVPAVIVMPADAPVPKIANTRAWGAEVALYDRRRESREAIGATIAKERGAVLVPPFDDARVIAGQGTVGLEIVEQAAEMDAIPDAVLVPCSGGGLVGGIAVALAARAPQARVYAVEPAGFDDMARSLASGERQSNAPLGSGPVSICDALLAPSPGEITWPLAHRLLAGGLTADDDAVRHAMTVAFAEFKLALEPGGAVALAALLPAAAEWRGRTVVVVGSGGNIDPEVFAAALQKT